MNIGLFGGLARDHAAGGRAESRVASAAFNVGQKLELTVLERLRSRRYRVLLGNSHRTVESTSELTPGTKLTVQVAASGERLVLHGAGQATGVSLRDAGAIDPKDGQLLPELAARHQVSLDAEQLALIQHAMQDAEEPQAMAAAGLFLGKLGLPLHELAMQAVYETQVWPAPATSPLLVSQQLVRSNQVEQIAASLLSHVDTNAAPQGSSAVEDGIARQADELQAPGSGLGADGQGQSRGDDRHERRALAQQLLNTHNQGSVGYRYGVLPLLIADQLVELDLVCFQGPAQSIESGLRRLTMSFNSAALGRVEVTAQALGTRLVLNIRAAGALPSDALAAHADEVRELATRLGWNVESLSYGHDVQLPRAATQLLQHVLNSDTLSRLL